MQVFLVIILIAVLSVVMGLDYDEDQAERDHYCEMVKLHWESNGDLGWPPFNGECDEDQGDETPSAQR